MQTRADRRDDPVVGHLLVDAGMGGAENYVALLANARAADERPSHVVVFSEPGPLSGRFDERVRVRYLGYRRDSIRNPLRFVASLIRGYRRISGAVRDEGIDVVQTHLPNTNLWGLALALGGCCRVVITIHNNKFLHSPGGTRLGMALKRFAYRQIVRHCDAVVAVSTEVRATFVEDLDLSRSLADRVVVVDNGVQVPEPPAPEERDAVRRRHGIDPGDFWIVAAGRLTEAKNFGCLVEAAAELRERGLPLRVTLGGEGPQRLELESRIAELGLGDRVAAPGNLDSLREMMQAADVLAMPSRWEGLPLVLLEAMACALPVVGTRIKGIADTIEDGVHGLLVDVDDPGQLAAALARLAEDRALLAELGESALRLVRERYDFRRVYAELDGIYDAVTARGREPRSEGRNTVAMDSIAERKEP